MRRKVPLVPKGIFDAARTITVKLILHRSQHFCAPSGILDGETLRRAFLTFWNGVHLA